MTHLRDMRALAAEHQKAGPTAEVQAADALLALLPADGRGIGNERLCRLLAEQGHRLSPSAYDRLREDLVAQGKANARGTLLFRGRASSLLSPPWPPAALAKISTDGSSIGDKFMRNALASINLF